MSDCRRCNKPLTILEERYYGCTCEACEVDQMERIRAWRAGAPDAELDAIALCLPNQSERH